MNLEFDISSDFLGWSTEPDVVESGCDVGSRKDNVL